MRRRVLIEDDRDIDDDQQDPKDNEEDEDEDEKEEPAVRQRYRRPTRTRGSSVEECPECDAHISSSRMENHLAKQHNIGMTECPECDAQVAMQKLEGHRAKVHNVQTGDASKPDTDKSDRNKSDKIPAPERVSKKEQDDAVKKPKKTGVSSGWFGSRAE